MDTRPDAGHHGLPWLVAQQEIRDVYYRYCRGIDRRDLELVRTCYHPDATDDHGDFAGGVDGFIEHVRATLPRFERTMHLLGNILVEVDPDEPTRARGEAYALAHHRLAASTTKPERDFVVALEWSRMDTVGENPYQFPERGQMGQADGSDPVWWPSLDQP